MYTVEKSDRSKFAFEVLWNKGRCIARCQTQRDADLIAAALNAPRAMVDKLTELM